MADCSSTSFNLCQRLYLMWHFIAGTHSVTQCCVVRKHATLCSIDVQCWRPPGLDIQSQHAPFGPACQDDDVRQAAERLHAGQGLPGLGPQLHQLHALCAHLRGQLSTGNPIRIQYPILVKVRCLDIRQEWNKSPVNHRCGHSRARRQDHLQWHACAISPDEDPTYILWSSCDICSLVKFLLY